MVQKMLSAILLLANICDAYKPVNASAEYVYTVHETPDSWGNAQATCEMEGADLASINDDYEHEEIVHTFPIHSNESYWMGLHEQFKEGIWEWSDFTCGNFRRWDKDEPKNNGRDEDCAAMSAESSG